MAPMVFAKVTLPVPAVIVKDSALPEPSMVALNKTLLSVVVRVTSLLSFPDSAIVHYKYAYHR